MRWYRLQLVAGLLTCSVAVLATPLTATAAKRGFLQNGLRTNQGATTQTNATSRSSPQAGNFAVSKVGGKSASSFTPLNRFNGQVSPSGAIGGTSSMGLPKRFNTPGRLSPPIPQEMPPFPRLGKVGTSWQTSGSLRTLGGKSKLGFIGEGPRGNSGLSVNLPSTGIRPLLGGRGLAGGAAANSGPLNGVLGPLGGKKPQVVAPTTISGFGVDFPPIPELPPLDLPPLDGRGGHGGPRQPDLPDVPLSPDGGLTPPPHGDGGQTPPPPDQGDTPPPTGDGGQTTPPDAGQTPPPDTDGSHTPWPCPSWTPICHDHYCPPVFPWWPSSSVVVGGGVSNVIVPSQPVPASPQIIDLLLIDVRLVDAGDRTRNLGPRYRITFGNNGSLAAGNFQVLMMASRDGSPQPDAPVATAEIIGLAAGQTDTVDVRLPLSADPGTYQALIVAMDSGTQVTESDEENNLAVLDRSRIALVQ